jgi:signal transduction histidine kinase/HAMP domain-containing protein
MPPDRSMPKQRSLMPTVRANTPAFATGLFQQVVNGLMAPAIRVMNSLSYLRKFVLISLLFALPLALVLYLLGSEIDQRVDLARKEIQGNTFNRSVRKLYTHVQQSRYLAGATTPGAISGSPDRVQADANIDEDFRELGKVNQDLGDVLATTEGYLSVVEAWGRLRQSFVAPVAPVAPDAGGSVDLYLRLLIHIDALRRDVGDSSNLILDPDLDTYYLMDATHLTLPEFDRVMGESRVLVGSFQRRQSPDPIAQANLIRITDEQRSLSGQVQESLTRAFRDSPSGTVVYPLEAPLERYLSTSRALVNMMGTLTTGAGADHSVTELARLVDDVQEATDVLWTLSMAELDTRLGRRIERFRQQKRLVLGFSAVMLAIVAYLLLAFYRAVIQTVRGLEAVTQGLVQRDPKAVVELAAQDELGQVARSFDRIARELRTEWLRTEQRTVELAGINAMLKDVIRALPGALLVADDEGIIRMCNDTASTLLERAPAELQGLPLVNVLDLAGTQPLIRLETSTAAAAVLCSESTLVTASGKRIPALVSIVELTNVPGRMSSLRRICIGIDIRDRKNLERELHQAQKLESVGRMAAGVAHEINTPVQFVSDSVLFVQDAMSDLTPLIEQYRTLHRSVVSGRPSLEVAADVTRAEEDADLAYLVENVPRALARSLDGLSRVTAIVRSMKEFAYPDHKEMASVDLNRAIQSTLVVGQSEYKYVADVETDFGDLPTVRCYGGDVHQVVLHIVVNAAHAIGDVVAGTERKGRITIRTRAEGEFAEISISDTGGGIPEAIRNRIFDPFFTTKEVGTGTGQGLAIVHSMVVKKHHGECRVETEMGHGTTFVIRLPFDGRAEGSGIVAA